MTKNFRFSIFDLRFENGADAFWGAHASRVWAKPSRIRELLLRFRKRDIATKIKGRSNELCFGETSKPARNTRAVSSESAT